MAIASTRTVLLNLKYVMSLCQTVVCCVSGGVSLSGELFSMFQLMSLCQKVVCCVLGDVTVSDSCLCLRWGQSVRELFVVFQVTSLCQLLVF